MTSKKSYKRGRNSLENTSKAAKKRPQTQENDETGLVSDKNPIYSKMFVDRGPNKRKIKSRTVNEKDTVEGPEIDSSGCKYANNDGGDRSDTSTDTDDTVVSDKYFNMSVVEPEETTENSNIILENQSSHGERIREFLKRWKLSDPGVCCICLESSTTEDNMLVYCDGDDCEIVCHQECYGIIHLPASDEPWYCDRCLAKPSETVLCALCPQKAGAFRRMKDGEAAGTWVHVVCALWMPGMWVGNTTEMSDITIENIDPKNWSKPCCVCAPTGASQEGATVHCDAGGCKLWIHVTCAQSLNLLECLEDDPEMSDPYFVYCPQHGSHEPLRLNGWERWYRRRDKFYEIVRIEEGQTRLNRVKQEDDIGISLREIFEDSYAKYRERREKRIAKSRRRIAQVNSSIRGFIELTKKSESQTIEYTNKLEIAKIESAALEAYLQNIQESLLVLPQSMINPPNLYDTRNSNNDDSSDPNVSGFNSLLKCLNVTPDVKWTQEAKDCAQSIDIDGLDTSVVMSLGLKSVQKIITQKAKEQKLRKSAKKGRKRVKTKNSNASPSKKKSNDTHNTDTITNKNASHNISKTSNTTTQNNVNFVPKVTRNLRGRPPKASITKRANKVNNDYFESVDVTGDDSINGNDDALPTECIEEGLNETVDVVKDRHFKSNGDTLNSLIANIDFTNTDAIMNVNANNINHRETITNTVDTNVSIARDRPVDHGVLNIATLLNPMENNNINNNTNIDSAAVNVAFANDNAKNNVNDQFISTNLNGNVGLASSDSVSNTPISLASRNVNTCTSLNGGFVNCFTGAVAGPSNAIYSSIRGLHNMKSEGFVSFNTASDTVARISYLTSSIVPATVPLFTATPTPAGFFTTTPVASEATISKKRKNSEENNINRQENSTQSEKRRKMKGRRRAKKVFNQDEEQANDKPKRQPVPQPICAICILIDPPPTDQPSDTYITPSKARDSMLLKGRDKVHRMVRCDSCTKWYHLACMNPPRRTMPTGGYIWKCEGCDVDSDASENRQSQENGLRASAKEVPAQEKGSIKREVGPRKWRLRSATKKV